MMKTFVVLCCFLAAAVASDGCVDKFMPLPVCGSDGKTYSNPWMLDCEREKHNKDLKFVKYGQCQNIDTAIRPDDDLCICSGGFDPVCGSDGKTYYNPCEFDCAKKIRKSLSKIGHMECENIIAAIKPDDDFCVCNYEYAPLCGSDGRTYSNLCEFNCYKKHDKSLKVVGHNKCEDINTAIKPDDGFCVCTFEYAPVCGSDGRTYANLCEFKCIKKQQPSLRLVGHYKCEDVNTAIKPDDGFCVCTFEYAPVCGSDGRTYANLCEFKCIKKQQPSLRLVGHYKCEDVNTAIKPDDDFCVCTFEYAPVCGSDGRTYANLCEFKCIKKQQPSLRLVGHYKCEDVNTAIKPDDDFCVCTFEYAPVCGSDGRTYANLCEFKCIKKQQPSLRLVGHYKCEDVNTAIKPDDDFCVCTYENAPVCGSDGRTYSSLCEFKCIKKQQPSLRLVGHDACEKINAAMQPRNPCVCTREWMPVCGSDGVTYGNHCEMKCAQSKNPSLEIVGMDECENLKKVKHDDSCACTREYMPVCGSDGRTYSNICVFRCSQSKNPELKLAHRGKCEKKEFETCGCSKEYKPVCGTDLKTYGNMCLFDCAASKKEGLKLMYKMVCMIV